MGELSDGDLVAAIRQGRRSFCKPLVERYWSKARNLIRRITGSPEIADDLCQETFLLVFQNLGQFDTTRSFSPWFFKIALNVARDHFRRVGRQMEFLPLPEEFHAGNLACPSEQAEANAIVDGFLSRLPLALKVTFILRHGLELSCQEIAQVLDEPVGTVKSNLFRAREVLKLSLRESLIVTDHESL